MFETKEGQKVPQVTFRTRTDNDWKDITSDELFKGKKVVVFSLPGAYTPTCSSTHLPRYNQLAAALKDNGIDDIVCLSVNDGFVMHSWGKDQQAENVRLIPDGNGEFTEKLGFLVDKSDLGFGKRSWRYSMLVNDGVIEKMFIEPVKDGDPFEVSDADTMLDYIAPKSKKPASISLVTKPGCPHCARAKRLLSDRNLPYEEIILGQSATATSLFALSGQSTTPQVFIDGKHIGGADDLEKHFS